MTSNAPVFDPLNPTPEEREDLHAGWLAAGGDEPKPAITSPAFDHGWRMHRNDLAGVVDDDQRELARRYVHAHETEADRLRRLERDISLFRRGRP